MAAKVHALASHAHRDANGGPCTHRSTPPNIQSAATYTTLSYLSLNNLFANYLDTLLAGKYSYESINHLNEARYFVYFVHYHIRFSDLPSSSTTDYNRKSPHMSTFQHQNSLHICDFGYHTLSTRLNRVPYLCIKDLYAIRCSIRQAHVTAHRRHARCPSNS